MPSAAVTPAHDLGILRTSKKGLPVGLVSGDWQVARGSVAHLTLRGPDGLWHIGGRCSCHHVGAPAVLPCE